MLLLGWPSRASWKVDTYYTDGGEVMTYQPYKRDSYGLPPLTGTGAEHDENYKEFKALHIG